MIGVLEARKDALGRLLKTSAEVRAALEANHDIGELLERRDRECRLFASLCEEGDGNPSVPSPQTAGIGHEIEQISQQILVCQAECQAIMKARLDALGGAIRESVHRRKLDDAYGPALAHDTPVFLDKQQ